MRPLVRKGERRFKRLTALMAIAVLSGGLATPGVASAAPGTTASTPEERASKEAKESRKQVPIPELTTETQLVVANPDGSFTAKLHNGPARFKDTSGAWVDIDLNLTQRADGTVAPRAHQNGLVLAGRSGPGDHDLAMLTVSGHEIALGWRGPLPEPTLEGPKATWPEVFPGVDLVVDVTRSGFEQSIVVKDRAGLAHVRALDLPWRASGLTEREKSDGTVELSKPDGAVVARIPAARMWDSRKNKAGDHLATARVDVKVRRQPKSAAASLAVTPDARFLDDSKLQFPVTIDPSVVTLTAGFDAFVQTGYVSDQSGNGDLKLGYSDDGGTWTARSYLRYDNLGGYANVAVQSAVLYLWEYHSWSCTAAGWEAWRVSWADSSLRWSKQPSWQGGAPVGTSTLTKGHDAACDDGWVTISVAGALQYAFSNSLSSQAIGLMASSENNHNGWKRFHSAQAANAPYVSLTYNRTPNTPTNLKAQGKACASGMTVSTTAGQPQLQATMSDGDGDSMSARFYVAEQGAAMPATPSASVSAGSGTVATVTIPTSIILVEGKTYVWQVEGNDGSATGPRASCEFKVDNGTMQTPPVVTSSDGVYPRNGSGGGPGVTGQFTFAPNGVSTVDRYQYRFIYRGQTTPWVTRSAMAGAPATIKWTPPFDDGLSTDPVPVEQLNMGGQFKLEVKMGNPTLGWFNNVETFTGQVRSAPAVATSLAMNEDETSTVLIDEVNRSETQPNGQRPATIHNLVKSPENLGDYGTSWYFNGTDAYAEGPSPIGLAPSSDYQSDSYAFSLWARLADKDSDHAALSNRAGTWDQFKVEYNKQNDRWLFTVDGGTYWGVLSTTVPQIGVWTHLAGTFDFTTRKIRFYVNGLQEGESVFVDSYAETTNYIWIGRSDDSYWHGEIDDVRLWTRVLDPREIAALASAETASWSLDTTLVSGKSSPIEPFDMTAHDQTGTVDITSDVSLPEQAAWWSPVGHITGDGGSIKLNNATKQYLEMQPASQPGVVRTGESFTVSAWVHLDTMPTGTESQTWTAVAQDGVCRSGFFLGVKILSGQANWFFYLPDRDTAADGVTCDSPSGARVSTPITTAQIGQTGSGESARDVWVQLVGVYDASANTSRLFVDGADMGVAARGGRWSAGGPFTVGRALWPNAGAGMATDFFTGRIDSVRISQGVQAPETVMRNFLLDGGVLASAGTTVPIVGAAGSAACQAAEGVDKVFDGMASNNSKWCSSATTKWIQVQTAAAQPLTGVMIYHAVGGGEWQPAFDTKDYDILTSTDGTTWSTAMQVRGNTAGVSRHTFTSAINAKYVKVNIITPEQSGGTVARIFEIVLYKGTKVPTGTVTTVGSTSSCSANETSDKAGDGSYTTRYCGYPKTLQADLGSVKTISSAVLWHAGSAAEYPGWNTGSFDILASVDGVKWTLVQQVRGNNGGATVHDFKYPINARYLKIDIMLPAVDNSNYVRLFEIEVYK